MAKKVSKIAICIIPFVEREKIVCIIYRDEALNKSDLWDNPSDSIDVTEYCFSTKQISTLVLHDGKFVDCQFET